MRPERVFLLVVLAVCWGIATPAGAQQSLDRIAERVLSEVNKQRALNGAGPLKLNAKLADAAQKHAEDMVRHDYFDHRSPDGRALADRATSAGYPWRSVAENIAAGNSTPHSTVRSWMTSPGHRDNMLDKNFQDAGVGYAKPTGDGKRPRYSHYWVMVFGVRSR